MKEFGGTADGNDVKGVVANLLQIGGAVLDVLGAMGH